MQWANLKQQVLPFYPTKTPKVLPLENMLILATSDLFIRFAVGKNGFSCVLCSGMEGNNHWNLQIERRGMRSCEVGGDENHCK